MQPRAPAGCGWRCPRRRWREAGTQGDHPGVRPRMAEDTEARENSPSKVPRTMRRQEEAPRWLWTWPTTGGGPGPGRAPLGSLPCGPSGRHRLRAWTALSKDVPTRGHGGEGGGASSKALMWPGEQTAGATGGPARKAARGPETWDAFPVTRRSGRRQPSEGTGAATPPHAGAQTGLSGPTASHPRAPRRHRGLSPRRITRPGG